jgi:UDP-N-acetylglucosamine 2-epimerase (non-hydrolysing)
MHKILFVLGTRPEAIKLCPLLLHLRRFPELFDVRLCVTAQHREMLDQVLTAFAVRPDYDLDSMLPGQSLFQSTSRIVAGLEPVLKHARPDMAIVQGDTTTTFCGALAAFYADVPIAHVEAGLRTGDASQPFPEEMNRVLAARLAHVHFAATETAASNLRAEGIHPSVIHVTGNTGIDAVLHVRDGLAAGRLPAGDWSWIDPARRLIVVTAHRRENFGAPLDAICSALADLAADGSVQIAWPVHPNPEVQRRARALAARAPAIHLLPPLDYVPFVDLMRRAYFLLSDSGGIQEEGPSLGKPILVLREKTERPEAVQAGTVKLVGADPARILREARRLLHSPASYGRMSAVHNPYGDGRASERIERVIRSFFRAKDIRTAA